MCVWIYEVNVSYIYIKFSALLFFNSFLCVFVSQGGELHIRKQRPVEKSRKPGDCQQVRLTRKSTHNTHTHTHSKPSYSHFWAQNIRNSHPKLDAVCWAHGLMDFVASKKYGTNFSLNCLEKITIIVTWGRKTLTELQLCRLQRTEASNCGLYIWAFMLCVKTVYMQCATLREL